MTVPAALIHILEQSSGKDYPSVTSVLKERIWHGPAVQGTERPFITFRRIGMEFLPNLKAQNAVRSTWRFEIVTEPQDRRTSYALFWALYEALNGFNGTIRDLRIQHILAQSMSTEAPEQPVQLSDDQWVWMVPADFEVMYDLSTEKP